MRSTKQLTRITFLLIALVLLLLLASPASAETDLEVAVRLATDAISEIPHVSMLQLSDKPAVENARYLVGRAKTEHGAVDADFYNLEWLVAAEKAIKEMEGNGPEEKKRQAIKQADEAIASLPHASMIRLTDRGAVENARYLVNKAKNEHGARDSDFEKLDWLVAAETAIRELEKPDPKPDPQEEDKARAVKLANDAIEELPRIADLQLSDRADVENARYLVSRAKTEHGAKDSDFDNLPKLEAAEERIRELEEEPDDKETAIKLANEAIEKLPEPETMQLSDKPAVENARYLVERAKREHDAVDADFPYLYRLELAEEKLLELEEGEKAKPALWLYIILAAAGFAAIVIAIILIKKSSA